MSTRSSAPGRVNLIGEHTDYNDGFVMPIATPQQTDVELTPRDDDRVTAWSANVDEPERGVGYRLGEEARRGMWIDYVAGVTDALRNDGRRLRGFDARIRSTVPLGAGLASSAALLVALVRAINEAFALDLGAVEIAQLAYRAETGLVGAPVGVMDQMAASLARQDTALFLDTRTLNFERTPLPPSTTLVVIHSGIVHRHAAGEYRVRRAECEEAARRLGVEKLRDAAEEDLSRAPLPSPLDRRARHVVSENGRVLGARDAMRAGDAPGLGALMDASHVSMRDDFEVSVPPVDTLVEIVRAQPGVFGARLTGGGFGGSIVALAETDRARQAARSAAAEYDARTGQRATVLVP